MSYIIKNRARSKMIMLDFIYVKCYFFPYFVSQAINIKPIIENAAASIAGPKKLSEVQVPAAMPDNRKPYPKRVFIIKLLYHQ